MQSAFLLTFLSRDLFIDGQLTSVRSALLKGVCDEVPAANLSRVRQPVCTASHVGSDTTQQINVLSVEHGVLVLFSQGLPAVLNSPL